MIDDRNLDHVVIVLVETSHPGNIGAVARASKNMGFKKLRLVSPKSFPHEEADRRASGADDLLTSAEIYNDLVSATQDCQLVVGASARDRRLKISVLEPRTCAELVDERLSNTSSETVSPIAMVFGPEATGLSNEDLQRCHYHMSIPANPNYASLNIAMAVQIMTYELRMAFLSGGRQRNQSLIPGRTWDEPAATVEQIEGMLNHTEQTLVDIGFHDPNNPRRLMARLRRLANRSELDVMEINILRGILKSINKLIDK